MTEDTGKPLTGRTVLIIAVSAFAVIIGVNVFMAYMAVGTFPGLEVKNSYVASQSFDDDRAAQEALGWEVSARIDGEQLIVDITGPDGEAVEVGEIGGILGRATHVLDDQTPEFSQTSTGSYAAPVGVLDFGNWEYRMKAVARDGTRFKQLLNIYIPRK